MLISLSISPVAWPSSGGPEGTAFVGRSAMFLPAELPAILQTRAERAGWRTIVGGPLTSRIFTLLGLARSDDETAFGTVPLGEKRQETRLFAISDLVQRCLACRNARNGRFDPAWTTPTAVGVQIAALFRLPRPWSPEEPRFSRSHAREGLLSAAFSALTPDFAPLAATGKTAPGLGILHVLARVFRWNDGTKWNEPGAVWGPAIIPPSPALQPFKPRQHMAQNRLPDSINDLINQAEDCADGAHQYEAAIPLKANLEADIRADQQALMVAKAAHDVFAQILPDVPSVDAQVQSARSNGRAFLLLVRDTLRPHLGPKGTAWVPLGWPSHSIEVPSTSERILPILLGVKNFLGTNSGFEISTTKTVVTAARADALWAALDAAVSSRNLRDTARTLAYQGQETAEQKLRKRLRGLIGELEQNLDPLDARWLAFGLNRPGADDPPEAPESSRATPLGGGKLRVQCDRVPRADYYQFWIQIVGVDPDFRRAETFEEPDKILEGLSAGTVKVRIRAVNEAGPGAFGDEVEVVVS